jgi:thioredoxin
MMKKKLLTSIFVLATVFSACAQTTATKATEPANSNEPVHLTKAEFLKRVANWEATPDQWVYLGDKPCLIDFYTTWCGPCKRIAPIVEELAKTYAGQIYVYKIDTDKEREIAALFNIRSIPSLLFVPMHGAPQMAVGAIDQATFVKIINEVLLTPQEQAQNLQK